MLQSVQIKYYSFIVNWTSVNERTSLWMWGSSCSDRTSTRRHPYLRGGEAWQEDTRGPRTWMGSPPAASQRRTGATKPRRQGDNISKHICLRAPSGGAAGGSTFRDITGPNANAVPCNVRNLLQRTGGVCVPGPTTEAAYHPFFGLLDQFLFKSRYSHVVATCVETGFRHTVTRIRRGIGLYHRQAETCRNDNGVSRYIRASPPPWQQGSASPRRCSPGRSPGGSLIFLPGDNT